MTPLHTPPHLWAPYPDETAPHGPPIRCDNPPPEMRRTNFRVTHKSLCEASDLAYKRREALRAIATEERTTSNATVKRMARMAREALK